jgi:hypothetical protein
MEFIISGWTENRKLIGGMAMYFLFAASREADMSIFSQYKNTRILFAGAGRMAIVSWWGNEIYRT